MSTAYLEAIESARLGQAIGRVCRVTGALIESVGPQAFVGEVCEIAPGGGAPSLMGEVVGFSPRGVLLMPYGQVQGVHPGSVVRATGRALQVSVGDQLLGRVIGAFGQSLDGLPEPPAGTLWPLAQPGISPMGKPRIAKRIETGVRAVDCFTPLGRGQRMGIFSGSGVGKSTLLGMVARNMDADVNIIALIGERSREVREFVEVALGPEGLRRSVVVVATADQPALTRVKAAYVAASLAEYFRGQGRHVMLTVDSMTRLAMARREIGLAVGEPPTARGYTPSVFTEIPEFCERCGTAENGASITALFTVLVEGDDFNEPIADLMRSTLDGHIVLSRELANEGHFPAIDILQSVSRLARELTTPSEQTILAHGIADLAAYQRNRQMLDIGVYKPGANPQFDGVVARRDALTQFLRQPIGERTLRADALQALSAIYASRGRP